jgi:hypothetical protein
LWAPITIIGNRENRMRSSIRAALLAGAVALGAGPAALLPTPAVAQVSVAISFDTFHDTLAAHGDWLYSDRWGTVWQPADVPGDFRPYYSNGHWVYTQDYGWMWVSDYDWGDIAFHYGRWVNDPDDGWLWIPGYTWSPAWVVWRTNNDYVGWMAMPPDQAFLQGAGISIGFGGGAIAFNFSDPYYGYRSWYGDYDDQRFASNWVFVGYGHVADPDYRRYAVGPAQTVNIVHQTRTVVNYTVVNNYVVNKGVDVNAVQRAAHHPIQAVAARTVIRHPQMVASIDAGRQAREQSRAVAPLGTGIANSAPPPSPQVVDKLSTQTRGNGGKPAAHLYTKADIGKPEVVNHFHGKPAGGAANANAGNPRGATVDLHNAGNPQGATVDLHNAGSGTGARMENMRGRHPGAETNAPSGSATPGGGNATGAENLAHRGREDTNGPAPGSEAGTGSTTGNGPSNGNVTTNETMAHRGRHEMNGPAPGGEPGTTQSTSRALAEHNRHGVPVQYVPSGAGFHQGGNPPSGHHTVHTNEAKPVESTPPPDGSNGGERAKHKDENNRGNGPH